MERPRLGGRREHLPASSRGHENSGNEHADDGTGDDPFGFKHYFIRGDSLSPDAISPCARVVFMNDQIMGMNTDIGSPE